MPEEKIYHTSKADFEYFQRHCWWWIKYFGLFDYEYLFFHEEDRETRASAVYEFKSRIISIYLSSIFESPFDKRLIAICAFHEVFESMLFKLKDLALRDAPIDTVEEFTHTVVNRMENTVFKDKWDSTLRKLK